MLISVDIGNTTMDFGLHRDCASIQPLSILPIFRGNSVDPDWDALSDALTAHDVTTDAIWVVGSVFARATQHLSAFVAERSGKHSFYVLENDQFPLEIDVEEPSRVGPDRLAAAVAVNLRRSPNNPAIIVDAGTAIKVDAVSGAGAFLGGSIQPGIRIISTSLADHTDRLPLVHFSVPNAHARQVLRPPAAIGRSTEAAIRSGVYWGVAGSVRMLIERISEALDGTPEIFVTGGDGAMVLEQLPDTARHVPTLVLEGVAATAVRCQLNVG